MSSHSSNNDMEVINPEDLEESPPPTDIVNEEEIQGGVEPEPMVMMHFDLPLLIKFPFLSGFSRWGCRDCRRNY